jgi:hypothetical protein
MNAMIGISFVSEAALRAKPDLPLLIGVVG